MNKPAGKRKNSVLDWVVALLILAALGGLAAKIAAGFEYNWNWLVPLRFFVSIDAEGGWRAGLLMQGLLMTLRLAIWGGLLCAILGLIIGLMRTSNLLIMRVTSLVFVESVRNIPPLVFIFIMYFFVSNQLLPPKLISFLADLAEDNSWFAVLFCPPDLIETFCPDCCVSRFTKRPMWVRSCAAESSRSPAANGRLRARSGCADGSHCAKLFCRRRYAK